MSIPDLIRGMVNCGYAREQLIKEHGYTLQQWSCPLPSGEGRLVLASTEEAVAHYIARQVERNWDRITAPNPAG
jgi:hypothetical protein